MDYLKQVDSTHYSFERYFFPCRWMSYWYQTKEITGRDDILSVLDVGPGTDFLRHILEIHRPDVTYTTVDVAADVNPDIIGGVTALPCADASYDAVCAFQVLEHIEFKDVPTALKEMARVSKRYVFISVPHFGPSVEWNCKMPFLPRLRLAFKIPFPKQHVFNGQHYWELGKRGYPPARLRNVLRQVGTIKAEYVPFENQYHHFFVIEKK